VQSVKYEPKVCKIFAHYGIIMKGQRLNLNTSKYLQNWKTDCSGACSSVNKTVLVIGPDLGFVFWLGQTLDRAGYEAFPARSAAAAAETVTEFHLHPGLVILTTWIEGANELIAELRRSQEHRRVLYLAGPTNHGNVVADKIYPRPAEMTERAKAELLEAVSTTLADTSVIAENSR
jgi:hypothetical protein